MSDAVARPQTHTRLDYIDGLRSAATLYIVGFWHLIDYSDADSGLVNGVTTRLVVASLGLFVFLSGFLLGTSRPIETIDDALQFYIRRLLRIYPLFLLAIALFYLTKSADRPALLAAVFCASAFTSLHLTTLWFVCVIMIYYMTTPLLLVARRRNHFVLAAIGVAALLAIGQLPVAVPDRRLLIYFPAFALGLACAGRSPTRRDIFCAVTAALFAVGLSAFDRGNVEHSLLSAPLAACVPLAIVLTVRGSRLPAPAMRIAAVVSYASFVMYLIHRPSFELVAQYVEDGPDRLALLVLVVLPIVVVAAWLIQFAYDRMMDRLTRHGPPPVVAS